jgi:uncharacterized protein
MDPNVSTTVPGVTTIQQIDQCAGVMGTVLTHEDLDSLRRYQSHLHGRICTMCGGCAGECPHGVAHSDFLRVVMYHDGYGDKKLVQEVLRTEDTLSRMQQCAECSSCAVTCRRGLDIHAQIKAVHRVFA